MNTPHLTAEQEAIRAKLRRHYDFEIDIEGRLVISPKIISAEKAPALDEFIASELALQREQIVKELEGLKPEIPKIWHIDERHIVEPLIAQNKIIDQAIKKVRGDAT